MEKPDTLKPIEEPKLEVLTEAKPEDTVNFVQRLRDNSDKFINLVMNYSGSKKQLQGVMAALTLHPFNDRPFQWSYPAQKELFELGNAITSDKLCLFHLGILEEKYAKDVKERTEKQAKENKEKEND